MENWQSVAAIIGATTGLVSLGWWIGYACGYSYGGNIGYRDGYEDCKRINDPNAYTLKRMYPVDKLDH